MTNETRKAICLKCKKEFIYEIRFKFQENRIKNECEECSSKEIIEIMQNFNRGLK